MLPKLTIITPTYNAAATLEETILSVVNQSYKNIEYILIDGNSTDTTINIIKEYAAKYPIIRWISEPDEGIYDAMNKGVGMSTGEWIYFLGSDDILYTKTTINDLFSSVDTSLWDVIYGDVIFKVSGIRYNGAFTVAKLYWQNICHQAIFARKEIFDTIGLFNTNYKVLADYEFNIRWIQNPNIRSTFFHNIIALYNEEGFSGKKGDEAFNTDKDTFFHSWTPPKVSIILPLDKNTEYLTECIESILQQSYSRLELILIANKESNNKNISEIINYYLEKDNRVHKLTTSSTNLRNQWDEGINISKGDIIWIANVNNYWLSSFLERMLTHLSIHASAGVLCCESYPIDYYNNNLPVKISTSSSTEPLANNFHSGAKFINKYMLQKNNMQSPKTILFRKDIYNRVGWLESKIQDNIDYVLWIKILSVSDIVYISEPPLNFHRNTLLDNNEVLSQNTKPEILSIIKTIRNLSHDHTFNKKTLKTMVNTFIRYWFQINNETNISLKDNTWIFYNVVSSNKSSFITVLKFFKYYQLKNIKKLFQSS
ncbi:glycosyltransferase [Xanthocytophaga agilis]|uniref:Glycosyltransferase n=1 Tax=Xanthocytophaga agilis TaxID=3048010 RepID=A0AAE3R1U2_9BACT|nr:glycosyltransferase [Xanthocytophaga agilis]MDJ1502184.1 glycosyltransferase [Xanthocytophaga agilis]